MHLVSVKRNFHVRLFHSVVRQSAMIYLRAPAYKTLGHANTCDQLSLFTVLYSFDIWQVRVVLYRFSGIIRSKVSRLKRALKTLVILKKNMRFQLSEPI